MLPMTPEEVAIVVHDEFGPGAGNTARVSVPRTSGDPGCNADLFIHCRSWERMDHNFPVSTSLSLAFWRLARCLRKPIPPPQRTYAVSCCRTLLIGAGFCLVRMDLDAVRLCPLTEVVRRSEEVCHDPSLRGVCPRRTILRTRLLACQDGWGLACPGTVCCNGVD